MPKMKNIWVITFCTEDYKPLADIILPNLERYCRKHGYDLLVRETCSGHFHYVKTMDAYTVLTTKPEVEAVLTIEMDCLITNHNYKIEDILSDQAFDIFLTTDRNGVNGGVVLYRNTPFAKHWLWWMQGFEDSEGYGDEQNVFEKHSNQKIKYCIHPCFNSIPYEPYYAPSYGKIGYKDGDKVDIPTEAQGHWKPSHFVMHLPGMTLEKRCEIFTNHLKDIIYE